MNCMLKVTQNCHLGQLKQFFASTLRLEKYNISAALLQTQANQSRHLSLSNVALKTTVDSQNEKSSIAKKAHMEKRILYRR